MFGKDGYMVQDSENHARMALHNAFSLYQELFDLIRSGSNERLVYRRLELDINRQVRDAEKHLRLKKGSISKRRVLRAARMWTTIEEKVEYVVQSERKTYHE